jgi:hypothetical protein
MVDAYQHNVTLGQAINLVHNEFTIGRQVKVMDDNKQLFKDRVKFMFKLIQEIREDNPIELDMVKKVITESYIDMAKSSKDLIL